MTSRTETRRAPAPILFFPLILPYGVSFGFIGVAFAYLATHAQHPLTTGQVMAIVSAAYLPHTFKLLWAPIVDQTLSKKAWYLISLGLTAAGTVVIAAMPISPERIPVITATVMISQVGLTLLGMSCETFLGLAVPDDKKGKASGWHQAGTNFGLGVGGGAALWLAQHLPSPWMSGGVLGALMSLCAIPLVFFDEPLQEHAHTIAESLKELGHNLGQIFTTRKGIIAMLICLSPISAGASSQLFAPAADHWRVSADTVALVTGVIAGLITSGGSLLGGILADRMSRRVLYASTGALMAFTAVLLAIIPHVPAAYVGLTLLYNFFLGIAYSAFTALVLETIGKGAVATKYNLFAGAMNLAVSYMMFVVGRADTRWGVNGALFTDASCTFGSIAVLMLLLTFVLRSPRNEPAHSSQPHAS